MSFKLFKYFVGLTVFVSLTLQAHSQRYMINYPKVGSVIEDHLFTDVDNYHIDSLRISDFRGKWLILDFWSRHCLSCVESFPKMNALHQEFKDKNVQLIMVGVPMQGDVNTHKLYERLKEERDLKFTTVFDIQAREKYAIYSLPYILIVNPDGIIVAKTTRINSEQIDKMLKGQIPPFQRTFSKGETLDYNHDLPLLTSGSLANGGIDTCFSYRSLLMPYNNETPFLPYPILYGKTTPEKIKAGIIEVTRISLKNLILYAYLGSIKVTRSHPQYGYWTDRLTVNTKQKQLFNVDRVTLEGIYSYSLIVPKNVASVSYMQKLMRSDLERYFSLKITEEEQITPIFKLVVIDKNLAENLRTKGEPPTFDNVPASIGFSFKNQNIQELLNFLEFSLPKQSDFSWYIKDETEMDFNIDMSMETDMYNIDKVNDKLKKFGLQLIQGEASMRCLVVTDSAK